MTTQSSDFCKGMLSGESLHHASAELWTAKDQVESLAKILPRSKRRGSLEADFRYLNRTVSEPPRPHRRDSEQPDLFVVAVVVSIRRDEGSFCGLAGGCYVFRIDGALGGRV